MPTYLAADCTSTSATTNAWHYWVTNTSTSCAISTADIVWQSWAESGNLITPITYSQAERELRREYTKEQREREAARVARENEAAARAEALLLDACTPEQRDQFRRHKHVIAQGASGLRYRIRLGRIGNIDVIDRAGKVSHRLCAHPRDDMPNADCVLIQKLMIEADEAAFAAVANRHAAFNRNERVLPALAA